MIIELNAQGDSNMEEENKLWNTMLFNVHLEKKCVHKCDFLLFCCLSLQNIGHLQFFDNKLYN